MTLNFPLGTFLMIPPGHTKQVYRYGLIQKKNIYQNYLCQRPYILGSLCITHIKFYSFWTKSKYYNKLRTLFVYKNWTMNLFKSIQKAQTSNLHISPARRGWEKPNLGTSHNLIYQHVLLCSFFSSQILPSNEAK